MAPPSCSATQYLDEADRLADDVVIIDAGRTVAQGSPDALKDAIGNRIDVVVESAADLEAAVAAVSRWAVRPPAIDPAIDTGQRRLSIPVAASSVTLPELVRYLDAARVRTVDVGIRRPTLDEVFLDRTGRARPGDDGEEAA